MTIQNNPILSEILKLFYAQQEKGLNKYGKYVATDNHTVEEWIEHAQQECIDNLVYLESLKQKLREKQ